MTTIKEGGKVHMHKNPQDLQNSDKIKKNQIRIKPSKCERRMHNQTPIFSRCPL